MKLSFWVEKKPGSQWTLEVILEINNSGYTVSEICQINGVCMEESLRTGLFLFQQCSLELRGLVSTKLQDCGKRGTIRVLLQLPLYLVREFSIDPNGLPEKKLTFKIGSSFSH